jgi:hypothetical protein
MPDIEMTEYKFPDEIIKEKSEAEELEPIEIEVIDDTPEEDRANAEPMPKEIVDELDNDDLEAFTGEAKKKLLQMKKVYNDERRAKNDADKERQEAVDFATKILEENKRLKTKLSAGEQTLVSNYKENVTRELEQAKQAYKDAYNSGDSDLLVDAQEKLTDVKLKAQDLERYQPQFSQDALQSEENEVKIPQTQRLDSKTQSWLDKNSWYGNDDDMSYLAMGIHRRLEREGVAVGSDHYYGVIDKEMRQRFPEKFGISEETKYSSEVETKSSTKTSKPSTVVAPATRSTSPKKVRLTPTQLQLAKKFNLTPEQYARELTKLESQNG